MGHASLKLFLIFILIVLAGRAFAQGPAPEGQAPADLTAWTEVLALAGADPQALARLPELLGPLPSDSDPSAPGGLAPAAFLERFHAAPANIQAAMKTVLAARLRELGRRGAVTPESVAALIGPEPAGGLPGSQFFEIPSVPAGAYQALLEYIVRAAETASPGSADKIRIDRALRAQLALSSPASRAQYHDFDLVWAELMLGLACADPVGSGMNPGIYWLYDMLRTSAGLGWLPPVPESAIAGMEAQGADLFLRAQDRARSLPDSLTGLTRWECGP